MPSVLGELVELRDRYTKHFATDVPGVYTARVSARPQHYLGPDDEWHTFEELATPVAGGWTVNADGVTTGIVNGSLSISYQGRSLTMKPTAIVMVDRTAPASRFRKLADANYSNVERQGRTIIVHDIFPNTDLNVVFTDNGVTKAFNVRQKPTLPDPSSLGWNPAQTYVVIVWDVTRPNGAVIKDAKGVSVGNGYAAHEDIYIQDGQGNTLFTFVAGKAISSNPVKRLQEGPVYYVVAGANIPFGEAIPYARTQIATYPLVIDPTTTLYPAVANDDGQLEISGAWVYTNASAYIGADGAPDVDDGKGGTIPGFATMYRWYGQFDLSGIPAGASASAASLNLNYQIAGLQSTTERIATWGAGTPTWGASTLATENTSTPSASGYHSMSVGTAALDALFGGSTKVAYRVRKTDETLINSTSLMSVYTETAIGTSFDPYLSITYTTGAEAKTGTLTATGGGVATFAAQKAAAKALTATGGGVAVFTSRKAAFNTLAVTGGGVAVIVGVKAGAEAKTGTLSVTGGGSAAFAARKAGKSSVVITGGGRVAIVYTTVGALVKRTEGRGPRRQAIEYQGWTLAEDDEVVLLLLLGVG